MGTKTHSPFFYKWVLDSYFDTAKKGKTEIADGYLLFIFAKSQFETNKLSMAMPKAG